MARTLIIAEKPSVAADIAKVVGASEKGAHAWEGETHVVTWAVGHLLEFVPPEGYDEKLKRWRLKDLPIIPEQFKVTPVKGATKQLTAVKRFLKAKDVDLVINACDAGREGELIFREIYRYSGTKKPVERLWLQSMTSRSIKASLAAPRDNESVQGLADSADCRAESDWLIGMNATRALTVRLRSARDRVVWSAGRVQTATLAMLVRREREILAHEPAPYWTIQATFQATGKDGHDYVGNWYDPDAPAPRDRLFDSKRRDKIVALLEGKPTATAKETRRDSRETAPALFDLTSLQREANRRFGFSARRTLRSAQSLYEQHKLITYPRTDSRALPSDYVEHVQRTLGVLGETSAYKEHARRLLADGLENEKRNFDDAAISDHFAIIPTGEGTGKDLPRDEARIFDLVVRRFLAGFHPPAVSTEVERITQVEEEQFRTRRKVLKVPGWRAVWDREAGDEAATLAALATPDGTAVSLLEHESEEKMTRPPSRLTEAAVLGLMETAGKEVEDDHLAQVLKETGGLGTPATRAETIETLIDRQYGSRCTNLEGRKALRATARGLRLIEALERIELPQLTSPELTADLEDSLRKMEGGERDRATYMTEIREWTATIVDKIRGFSFDTLYEGTEPLADCPLCGKKVVETLRTWVCQNGGRDGECSFVIWKEVGGRYVDRASALQLVIDKETPTKSGFFTRDNREFEASLVLQEDGRVRVRRKGEAEMAAQDVEPVDVGPCPFHADKLVRRTASGYRCDGYADGDCKLSVPLAVCQKELRVEDIAGLIGAERKTELIEGFVSKRNRPFSATLHLTDAGRFRWEFPPRNNAAGGDAKPAKEFPVNPEPIASCPQKDCPGDGKGKIVETPTTFACNSEGCRIAVPREICQREVTREEVTGLFAKKESEPIEGFISRAGKPFTASLYLKRTGRHGFRFSK